jgi:hypothetical protein
MSVAFSYNAFLLLEKSNLEMATITSDESLTFEF